MTIHVQSHDGTPLPRPEPLASADFQNGVYALDGAPAVLADLLVATSRSGATYPLPTLTAGVGWNSVGTGVVAHTGYSASAALLTLMDLTGAGCSMVIDMSIVNPSHGVATLDMPMGDYPDWALGWDSSLAYNAFSSLFLNTLQDFFSPDVDQALSLPFDGKFANTLSPASLLSVVNDGAVISRTPPDAQSLWSNPSFLDVLVGITPTDARVLIRSIKWYPAQTADGLKLLTS